MRPIVASLSDSKQRLICFLNLVTHGGECFAELTHFLSTVYEATRYSLLPSPKARTPLASSSRGRVSSAQVQSSAPFLKPARRRQR